MPEVPPILIIGGGIGGLTLSLALAEHDISSHILESRTKFSELGAGIQLGPNATGIFDRLGFLDDLRARAFLPRIIEIKNGETEERLAALPVTPYMEARFAHPYLTLRRADLQNILLEQMANHTRISVTHGFRLMRARRGDNNQRVFAKSDQGAEIEGTALIGADGLWSQTREIIAPDHPLQFSGKTAWRTLLPLDALPPGISMEGVGLWLGPKAHLVHYPVGPDDMGDRQLNIVAIIDDQSDEARWSTPAEARDLRPHYASWGKTVNQLLDGADNWRKWSLFDAPKLARWYDGPICLMGDAAHPVLPFLAQGGAMAIEDAFILAECIAAHRDDITSGFEKFEAIRKPRTSRVQSASRKNGARYHMKFPFSTVRDIVLKRSPPAGLLGTYDWLYGYQVEHLAR